VKNRFFKRITVLWSTIFNFISQKNVH